MLTFKTHTVWELDHDMNAWNYPRNPPLELVLQQVFPTWVWVQLYSFVAFTTLYSVLILIAGYNGVERGIIPSVGNSWHVVFTVRICLAASLRNYAHNNAHV
jgi:hypothetical protein